MCGIVGYYNPKAITVLSEDKINNILYTLRRRGPNASGYYCDSKVFLGHTRLSIIDLDSGSQPIYNENGSKCIVFNGEIFNFKSIRSELMDYGHIFTTNTDTEVILHAYEEWGIECIQKFRGMFSFAIYDVVRSELIIVRDRLGIKPLFYCQFNGDFYFASEIKAILKMLNIKPEIDMNALSSYFALSYIPAPLTIFKHIRKLLPGHYIQLSINRFSINKYWDINFTPDDVKSEKYYINGIKELLNESISLRLISDVPVGAFLSGGIDSGIIVASMAEVSKTQVHTFCMGYGGNSGGFLDERKYAKLVADLYETDHEEYEVKPDVECIIDDIVEAFDEPFADSSTIPSYYLARLARKKVTVALSGLGGDELFGGYERYLGYKLSKYYNMLPLFIRTNIIESFIDTMPERSDGHYTINHMKRFVRSASLSNFDRYFGFISLLNPTNNLSLFIDRKAFLEGQVYCKELLYNYFNSANASDSLDKVFYTDIKTYLPDDILACTDRTSMWHSLEVRVPFLDHKLLEFCARIPNNMKISGVAKKHILKLAYRDKLPHKIFNHRKQGFIGPMTKWLQNDLKKFVCDTLCNARLNKHGILDNKLVNNIINEHNNGNEINDKLIWSLLMFQLWYEKYIERKVQL